MTAMSVLLIVVRLTLVNVVMYGQKAVVSRLPIVMTVMYAHLTIARTMSVTIMRFLIVMPNDGGLYNAS